VLHAHTRCLSSTGFGINNGHRHFEEVVEEVTYAVKLSNFVVIFVLWLLSETRSYIVQVKVIMTPSGYGRHVIQPIVSRYTISRVLEIYYEA